MDEFLQAVNDRDLEEIKELIDKVDINGIDDEGRTALHNAAESGNLDIMNYLLTEGAKINIKNQDGMTPLMLVVQDKTRQKAVELLISNGCIVLS